MVNESILCYLGAFFLVFCVTQTDAGDVCRRRYFHRVSTTYCTYGCCGSWNNEYCCAPGVALITGCMLAGVLGMAIIIAVVCCCIKKKGHSGRVVQPTGAPPPYGSPPGQSFSIVYTGTSGQYPGYGPTTPGQFIPPPEYKQYEDNNLSPPAYDHTHTHTHSDPPYPPTYTPATPAPDSAAPAEFSANAPEGGFSPTAPPPSPKLGQ
ncbi:hypothetical protein ACOMHN_050141 [Nucella lapillus]